MAKTGNMQINMNKQDNNRDSKPVEDLVVLEVLEGLVVADRNILIRRGKKGVFQIFLNRSLVAREEEEARRNIVDRITMQN